MAYRETPKVKTKKKQIRQNIVDATHELVAEDGFITASVQKVAERAGIATGTVYRYFPSKAELFSEVFRRASQREVDRVNQALATPGTPTERLTLAMRKFGERAMRSRRLAYALIAEPVDPRLDEDRLEFRLAYANAFAKVIAEGIEQGDFIPQPVMVVSTAIVGALAETLIGPLSPNEQAQNEAQKNSDDEVIAGAVCFCITAVCGKPPADQFTA